MYVCFSIFIVVIVLFLVSFSKLFSSLALRPRVCVSLSLSVVVCFHISMRVRIFPLPFYFISPVFAILLFCSVLDFSYLFGGFVPISCVYGGGGVDTTSWICVF